MSPRIRKTRQRRSRRRSKKSYPQLARGRALATMRNRYRDEFLNRYGERLSEYGSDFTELQRVRSYNRAVADVARAHHNEFELEVARELDLMETQENLIGRQTDLT
jgi:hypothetical protein